MIYGASGYTGKKLAAAAKELGLEVVLAGRNPEAVKGVAQKLDLEWRSFSLVSKHKVKQELQEVSCLLNAASPYITTARILMDICIETGSHYADLAGELEVYDYAEANSEAAVQAGVMLMPGVGWDVVATDSLAFHTARSVDQPLGNSVVHQARRPDSFTGERSLGIRG